MVEPIQNQLSRDKEVMITRAAGKKAFYELRAQALDVPEMSLDEINAEISEARAERKR